MSGVITCLSSLSGCKDPRPTLYRPKELPNFSAVSRPIFVFFFQSSKRLRLLATSGVFSETGPPTEIADRLNASFPTEMVKLLSQRSAPGIAATLDRYATSIA